MKRTISAGVVAFAVLALTAFVGSCLHPASAKPKASHTSLSKLMQEAEDRMVDAGYLGTFDGAYWAADQGPRIVPVLAVMLTRQDYYEKKYDEAIGDFPYNAFWALAHIPTTSARDVLQKYYAKTHDSYALLAIQGWELRKKHGQDAGVLANDGKLLAKCKEESKVLANLRAGEPVVLIQHVENDSEEGPRGGPATYEQVRVIRTKQTGYIKLAGEDFDPTY